MPTSFTEKVAQGQSFEEFVWRCARNMGATIMMRDDSLDKRIPEKFEPEKYYSDKVQKTKNEISEIESLTPEMAEAYAREDFNEDFKWRDEATKRQQSEAVKYKAMIEKVASWTPPSANHEDFKDFMLNQLKETLDFDCGCDYFEGLTPKRDGFEWKTQKLLELKGRLERDKEEVCKEIERVENRNKWLRLLRESVPQP